VSWLDELSKSAKGQAKEKFVERKLEVRPIFIQTRAPDEEAGDPGQLAEGYFVLSPGLTVTLTDKDGVPIEDTENRDR
jgi:hypothetical protein